MPAELPIPASAPAGAPGGSWRAGAAAAAGADAVCAVETRVAETGAVDPPSVATSRSTRSASCASSPLARTISSWPSRTPSVAIALSEPAGAGPAPVVAFSTSIRASSAAAARTNRAAGRACSPCATVTTKRSSTVSGGGA